MGQMLSTEVGAGGCRVVEGVALQSENLFQTGADHLVTSFGRPGAASDPGS